jgi:hypothetical protein
VTGFSALGKFMTPTGIWGYVSRRKKERKVGARSEIHGPGTVKLFWEMLNRE